MAAAHAKDAPGHIRHALIEDAREPLVPLDETGWVDAVSGANPEYVRLEVTHQPLDDGGAGADLISEEIASSRGQPPGGDSSGIITEPDFVLHISVRHPPNCRGAYADQRFAIVRGVALEITPQPAFCLGSRKFIVGKGEMVESDVAISSRNESIGDSKRLIGAGCAIGKRRLVDQALVLLEAGNVRIAEHRQTVRTHGERRGDRIEA